MDELPLAKQKKSVQVGPGESSSRHTRRQADFSSTLEEAASSNPTTEEAIHIIDDTNLEVDIDTQHLYSYERNDMQHLHSDERNEEDGQKVVGAFEENTGDQNEGENTQGGDNEDEGEDEGENTEDNRREIEGEENTHPLEDQEEIVFTTQKEGSKQKKHKVDIFGKILETSTPQAFLDSEGTK